MNSFKSNNNGQQSLDEWQQHRLQRKAEQGERETMENTGRVGVRDLEQKKRKHSEDPGKSNRLIDIVKKVTRGVKTRGSSSVKTHSTSRLPARRGERGKPLSQDTGSLCGHCRWRVPLSARWPTPGRRIGKEKWENGRRSCREERCFEGGMFHRERLSIKDNEY